MRAAGFLTAALLCAAPAFAQEPEVDCARAEAQMELTYCADKDYALADKALNAQWKLTREAAQAADGGLEVNEKGADKALLRSQRAWIDYRDATCEVAGFPMRGGTGEPHLILLCLRQVTETRTAELKALAEALRLR